MMEGQAEPTLKERIKEHYDKLSPYYHSLWGVHIHHGFWETGKETKEEAQSKLIELVAKKIRLQKGSRVLDVGCGVGGSSIYLGKNYNASVTGITISSTQVAMATEIARREGMEEQTRFIEHDAERLSELQLGQPFDIVWICEALSHLDNREEFFANANKKLRIGGRIAIVDWTKASGLTKKQEADYIQPIVDGMLLPRLSTLQDYAQGLERQGFRVLETEDISRQTAKTWDICIELVASPTLWKLAVTNGKDFIHFLRAFQSMRAGFASKAFIFGIVIAEKVKDLPEARGSAVGQEQKKVYEHVEAKL